MIYPQLFNKQKHTSNVLENDNPKCDAELPLGFNPSVISFLSVWTGDTAGATWQIVKVNHPSSHHLICIFLQLNLQLLQVLWKKFYVMLHHSHVLSSFFMNFEFAIQNLNCAFFHLNFSLWKFNLYFAIQIWTLLFNKQIIFVTV